MGVMSPFNGTRWSRLFHEAEASERRAKLSGAQPLVELPKRLEHPLLKVQVVSGKRMSLASDVKAFLDATSKRVTQ